MNKKVFKAETLAIHGGSFRRDETTHATEVPIYQTTSYLFDDTQDAADLFALKKLGNIYTRLTNPTTGQLAERVCALDGGALGIGVSSGQSAISLALLNLTSAGDNIISSTDLYGGSWNLFKNTFKQFGIEVRFVDPTDPQNFEKATDDKTRAYFGESLPNPKLQAFPISEVAQIGKKYGIPLIIDNTISPILCKPAQHGAAVIVYSATKILEGHGTSLGGVIVDTGTFDWELMPERQPLLNTADPNYHGLIWTRDTKPIGPVAFGLRIIAVLLRDLGCALSPFNSFQILQGIKTLALRLERQSENTQKVVDFLNAHPKIERVIHPSLQEGVHKQRAEKYFPEGLYSCLLGFEIKAATTSAHDAGKMFIEKLQLLYHVANIGDSKSLAIHPASTTHSQLTEDEQKQTGVTPGYIRLSIGIEHIDDILNDIKQALDSIK